MKGVEVLGGKRKPRRWLGSVRLWKEVEGMRLKLKEEVTEMGWECES